MLASDICLMDCVDLVPKRARASGNPCQCCGLGELPVFLLVYLLANITNVFSDIIQIDAERGLRLTEHHTL